MRLLTIAILFLTMTASLAMAGGGSVGLDFNNDSAEGTVAVSINEDEYGKIFFNGRYLYNSDERTNLGSGALTFYGEPGNIPGLTIGAGFIGYIGKSHKVDTLNVGLKGEVEYMPEELKGVGFAAKIGYAPKVFSFMDSDGLTEYNGQIFYAVTPKIHIYTKYQYIIDNPEVGKNIRMDRDLRIGLRGYF